MGTDSTGVRLGAGTTGEPPNRGALLGRTPAACAHEHWGAWPGSGGSASREPTFVTGSSPVGAAGPGEGPSTNPLEGLPGVEPLGVLGAEARRTGRRESGSDCASQSPAAGAARAEAQGLEVGAGQCAELRRHVVGAEVGRRVWARVWGAPSAPSEPLARGETEEFSGRRGARAGFCPRAIARSPPRRRGRQGRVRPPVFPLAPDTLLLREFEFATGR